jgi:hypothetical protein
VRLDRTADCVSEKTMADSMRWTRKIGEGILTRQNKKRKKKIKTWKDFWAAENWKFDSNGF